jgi:hypothetical protein
MKTVTEELYLQQQAPASDPPPGLRIVSIWFNGDVETKVVGQIPTHCFMF